MILLAQEHGELREALACALESDGAVVDAVSSGTVAIERVVAQRFRPDVVVSDVRSPRESGLHVLTALRSAGLTTPVILLTAGDRFDPTRLAGLGGAIVLEMPFDVAELRAALRSVPTVPRRESPHE